MIIQWVKCTTSTAGSGNQTVAQASGLPIPTDLVPVGKRVGYTIRLASTGAPLESGIGYFSSSTVFVREQPMRAFLSGTASVGILTAITLPAGTYEVIVTPHESAFTPGLPHIKAVLNGGGGADNVGVMNAWQSTFVPAGSGAGWPPTDTDQRFNFMPFKLEFHGPFNGFKAHIKTAQSGKVLYCGLYEMDPTQNNYPGSLVVANATPMSFTTAGVQVTGSFTSKWITPGWYWIGTLTDATTGRISEGGNTGGNTPMGLQVFSSNFLLYKTQTAGTSSAMPSTAPAGMSLTTGIATTPGIILTVG